MSGELRRQYLELKRLRRIVADLENRLLASQPPPNGEDQAKAAESIGSSKPPNDPEE